MTIQSAKNLVLATNPLPDNENRHIAKSDRIKADFLADQDQCPAAERKKARLQPLYTARRANRPGRAVDRALDLRLFVTGDQQRHDHREHAGVEQEDRPFPLPCADQVLPSLWHATPSVVAEHKSEFAGCPPNLLFLSTCCVDLEPRPFCTAHSDRLLVAC